LPEGSNKDHVHPGRGTAEIKNTYPAQLSLPSQGTTILTHHRTCSQDWSSGGHPHVNNTVIALQQPLFVETSKHSRLLFIAYNHQHPRPIFVSRLSPSIITMFSIFNNMAGYSTSSNSSYSSSTSSTTSLKSQTPSSEPTHPIQIGFTPAGSDALLDIFHASEPLSASASACAFPSWPKSDTLFAPSRRGASYISDEDLFGDFDDLSISNEAPYLSEPPTPPRQQQEFLRRPAQPLPSTAKPKARRGSKKVRRVSKPMTPIPESPV